MEGGQVSTGALVAGGHLLVDGGEERTGTAGEIADAKAADGLGVGPVHFVTGSLQLGHGQTGQQSGGLGAGVEGSEVFAVGDEPLKDAPGQVMGVGDAGGLHLLGGVAQHGEDLAGVAGVELTEDVPGDGEYGPVVDFQDGCPGRQGLGLWVGDLGAADEVEGLHPFVLTGNALVERQGVGDDGAGHPAGLGNVGLSQKAGNLPVDARGQILELVEDDRGFLDAFLEGGGSEVHFLLRNGDQANEVGQVGDRAFEPAGLGEAAAVFVEDAVGEAGIGDGLG